MRHWAGMENSPPSSCKVPLSTAKSEDLPAPLRPTKPTFSPGLSVTDVLSSNTLLPRRKVTFLRIINGESSNYTGGGLYCSRFGEIRFAVRRKLAGGRVSYEEHARANAEIRAMQLQRAFFDRFDNGREGHQIFEAVFDHRPFQPLYPALPITVRRSQPLGDGGNLRHPLADKVSFAKGSGLVGEGRYAAAACVTQHHDVFDF